MKLPVVGSTQTLAALAQWVSSLASAVSAGWNVDHKPDGTHKFAWIDVPFVVASFGLFTATTQTRFKYCVIGSTMFVAFDITGTVAVTPTRLQLTIPGGYSAAESTSAGTFAYSDAGTAGNGDCIATGQRMDLYKTINAPAWTNGTARVQGTVCFEVTR